MILFLMTYSSFPLRRFMVLSTSRSESPLLLQREGFLLIEKLS